MTQLHAGGKFDQQSYKVSGGLHGVGVSVVNALSEYLELTIWRGGVEHFMRFEEGTPEARLAVLGDCGERTGAGITFRPSAKVFLQTEFDIATLEHRLRELAFLNSGIHIILSDRRPVEPVIVEMRYEGGVEAFVKHLDRTKTMGGNNCCSPHIVPWGPYDQRPVEMRGDVLCYTSAPLKDDLEVTGPIQAVLYAATDGVDTDWTAKLVDVSPTGYARNLCDGIIRARYRENRRAPTLLKPDEVYEYRIDLGVTGNVFLSGHRIRVEVSSSNFPRFDRNLNTGHELGADAEIRRARQTVCHSKEYPSHILLPVV